MTLDLEGEMASALGVQAYIWGFPIVEMVRTCRTMTSVKAPQPNGRAPINQFGHSDHRWTHLDRDNRVATDWIFDEIVVGAVERDRPEGIHGRKFVSGEPQ